MTRGFIYIIEDEPNICKVGKTTKSVYKRCSELSACFHREFKILGFMQSEDIDVDEKIIHILLKSYKIRGEWFKISYDEIMNKISDKYTFNKYKYAFKPEGKLNRQMNISVTQEVYDAFNEIHATRLQQGIKSNKNWLFCEMIQFFAENGGDYE